MKDIIKFIQEILIENGLAYVIQTEIGNFICVDKYPISVIPVQYEILKGNMHYDTDYPIWAPYIEGITSPWGNGHTTVNLQLLLNDWFKNN